MPVAKRSATTDGGRGGPTADSERAKPAAASRPRVTRQPAKLAPGLRLPPEVVRASQRERLMIALIEAVDGKGLPATTVADLIGRAHVSRAAFYEQFDSVEDCFLATYDAQVERVGAQLGSACRTPGLSWDERIEATIGVLADAAYEWPAAARVCLSDILVAGPRADERRERTIALVRRLLRGEAGAGAGSPASRQTAIAVTGGLRRIVEQRLRLRRAPTEREQPAAEMASELTSWLLACGPPSRGDARAGAAGSSVEDGSERHAAGRGDSDVDRHSRAWTPSGGQVGSDREGGSGGESLSARGSVADDAGDATAGWSYGASERRGQIVAAVLDLAASKGYGAMTHRDIAARAKVSFSTFYEHFENKQQALLAACELASERLLAPVGPAAAAAPDWAHGVRAGIAAYLGAAAESPAETHVASLEVLSIGPAGTDQIESHASALERLLEPGFELRPETSRSVAHAFAGAAIELLRWRARERRTAELPGAGPELSYLALAPFLGRKDAQRIAGYRPRYPGGALARETRTLDRGVGARRGAPRS